MAQRLEKCVQGELHSSIHFYWGLSMSSHQNWFIFCAFKSAGPRLLQIRPDAAKNFKCAFNTSSFYWRFGANLSILCLPFHSPPQMFVWGFQRVCTCACLEASSIYFSLSGVEKPVSGNGNGNHFLFSIFGDLGLMSVRWGVLDWSELWVRYVRYHVLPPPCLSVSFWLMT